MLFKFTAVLRRIISHSHTKLFILSAGIDILKLKELYSRNLIRGVYVAYRFYSNQNKLKRISFEKTCIYSESI